MDNIGEEHRQLNADFSELRAIIFDFDGTLVDSEPIWKQVFLELYKETYNIEVPMKLLRENTGKGVQKSVENIHGTLELRATPIEREMLVRDICFESYRRIVSDATLRDGAIELFDFAKDNKLDMAICSASEKNEIEMFLKNRDLLGHFTHITSTSDYPAHKKKPQPYPYLETLAVLEVTPFEAVVFEDSYAGLESATSAGIRTFAIDSENLDDSLRELKISGLIPDFHSVLDLFSSSK